MQGLGTVVEAVRPTCPAASTSFRSTSTPSRSRTVFSYSVRLTAQDNPSVNRISSSFRRLHLSANGFDNGAESLHVSSFLMEQYLEAADKVLDAAIVNGPKPWMIKKRFDIKNEKSVRPKGSVYRHLEDSVAIFSSWVSANIQVTLWQFFSHFRGNYRFRISAYAYQTNKPVTFHMAAGTMQAVTEERIVGYYDVPPGKPTEIKFIEKLEPRNTVRFVVDNLGVTPPVIEKVGGGELQRAWPGDPVGGDRRAAARNLAAGRVTASCSGT